MYKTRNLKKETLINMKKLINKTKSTSFKTIAGLCMVASLALSPLGTQLSLAAETNKTNQLSTGIDYPMAQHFIKMIDHLKLSPEETKLIGQKLTTHKKEYTLLTSNIKKTKHKLLKLPANATETELKTLAQAQSDNIQKLIQLRVKIRQEIFSILSPQQREQLTYQWKKLQKEQIGTALNTPQNTASHEKNSGSKENNKSLDIKEHTVSKEDNKALDIKEHTVSKEDNKALDKKSAASPVTKSEQAK
jgi:Spy/CpxP family protein refolding chaperone